MLIGEGDDLPQALLDPANDVVALSGRFLREQQKRDARVRKLPL
jgi:hypothetical protein